MKLLPTDGNVRRLQPFLALGYLEVDSLALFQGLEAVTFDRGEVYEDVTFAIFPLDKAVTLFVTEPLHGARFFRANV